MRPFAYPLEPVQAFGPETALTRRDALDRRPAALGQVFPPFEPVTSTGLRGRGIGLVATGGSGVLASVAGVARAIEEAGLELSVLLSLFGLGVVRLPARCGAVRRGDGRVPEFLRAGRVAAREALASSTRDAAAVSG